MFCMSNRICCNKEVLGEYLICFRGSGVDVDMCDNIDEEMGDIYYFGIPFLGLQTPGFCVHIYIINVPYINAC